MEIPQDITGWEVHRFHHGMSRIKVLLGESPQRTALIAKLRQLLPDLRERPIAELLAEARVAGNIDLGVMESRERWKVCEILRHAGFQWTIEDRSFISYTAIHRIGDEQYVRLIEDDREAEAFCLELIRRGAPVIVPVVEF